MQHFMLFVFMLVVSVIVVAEPARAEDVGLADRTAAEHATDTPVPTPAATTPPDAGVHSRPAIYTSIAGQKIEGWIAWPAGQSVEGMPALIVIHEWSDLMEVSLESVTRIIEITPNGVIDFGGTYDEYLQSQEGNEAARVA